jgi:two-component system response regulator MtrA
VVLVGDIATEPDRIAQLLASGAVIVLARDASFVRAWLPGMIANHPERHRPHLLVRADKLKIDLTEQRAWWAGKLLELTEHELHILAVLARDPGRVWTFAELLQDVWGTSYCGDVSVVRQAMKRLRKKLAVARAEVIIESVRGVGFRLALPPGQRLDLADLVSVDGINR